MESDDPPDSCLANCKIDGTARAERALADTESGRYLSAGFLEVEEPERTSWSLRKRGRLTTENEAAGKGPLKCRAFGAGLTISVNFEMPTN